MIILAAITALPNKCERYGVPLSTVLPCPSDFIAGLIKKSLDGLISELVAIFSVNGFAWHEMNIKVACSILTSCSRTLSRCISIRDSFEFQITR